MRKPLARARPVKTSDRISCSRDSNPRPTSLSPWHPTSSRKKKTTPCNRPWRPLGLWNAEAPTFSRQSAQIWWWGCQPYAPAALYPQGWFLLLIFVRGWVDPRDIVRLEGLGQLKISVNLIGNGTRHLLACSIVPPPTTLPRTPLPWGRESFCK
jgi:hypothetical protein